MKPKRVFILGLQRSGTTWLANMLAALPQVAAVAHESHRGVHESVVWACVAQGSKAPKGYLPRRFYHDPLPTAHAQAGEKGKRDSRQI